MFNITKDDLAKKSDAQLSALFQDASRHLISVSPDTVAITSLLAMIRAERAKRGPSLDR